jgi:hypothetical protein
MQLKVRLIRTHVFPELPSYQEELDDVRSILSDVCGILADTGSAEFLVSGFGQERWPVDVRTDLPVFLEQIPDAAAAVESNAPFSIEFYEQGVERVIFFEPQGELYSARCESQTDWRPDPEVETIGRQELREVFSDIREGLMRFLSHSAPRIATHPWMQAWAGVVSE